MTKREPPPADFDDNPEWAEADFARARPFEDCFPAAHRSWKRTGRPPAEAPKVHVGFRLSADVVAAVKASGRGYNARVDKLLRDAIAEGKLRPGG